MIHIKAPDMSAMRSYPRLFLAGSIEQGKADKWQARVVKRFKDDKVTILDPRRDDWDPSWKQDPTYGTDFHEQVTWELSHIQRSDVVFFNFEGSTKSPISLLELGLCVGLRKKMVIRIDDDFWRLGNVVLTANLANAVVTRDWDAAIIECRYLLGV